MDARIIDITPPGGPVGVVIWQLQTLHDGMPHNSSEGSHTSTNPSQLRELAQSEGLNITEDESL